MPKKHIHIDNLRIKLPRGMAGDARDIAAGVGREVMNRIADVSSEKTGKIRINNIDTATINTSRSEVDIRKRVADQISTEVMKRFA